MRHVKSALLLAAGVIIAVTGAWLWLASDPLRYGWVVFGPDAKLKVLVALQDGGDVLFVDRDGDGALSAVNERFGFSKPEELKGVTFKDADGKTTYTLTGWSHYEQRGHHGLILNVNITGPVSFKQYADVSLSRSRSAKHNAHFNGPLAVELSKSAWKAPEDLALSRGEKPTDLRVLVGTVQENIRCWTVVSVMDYRDKKSFCVFPDDARPVVAVEFPAKKPGEAPVKRHYVLKDFC